MGEAYAFGVIWSFVFMSLSMLILCIQAARASRIRGTVQLPRSVDFDIPSRGCAWIFLVLASRGHRQSAHGKRSPRSLAWRSPAGFFAVFWFSERAGTRRRVGKVAASQHEHLEQFIPKQAEPALTSDSLAVDQTLSQARGNPVAV